MRLRKCLLICLVAVAFAKVTTPSNLPITTTLLSTDTSGTISDIQSDGLGSYRHGVDGVTSFLTTNGYNGIIWGDWQFGTLNSVIRKVSLSFANPIQVANGGTATPNPPFVTNMVVAHIEDKCTMISSSMIGMTAGQQFPCPAIVHFFNSATSTGSTWRRTGRSRPLRKRHSCESPATQLRRTAVMIGISTLSQRLTVAVMRSPAWPLVGWSDLRFLAMEGRPATETRETITSAFTFT